MNLGISKLFRYCAIGALALVGQAAWGGVIVTAYTGVDSPGAFGTWQVGGRVTHPVVDYTTANSDVWTKDVTTGPALTNGQTYTFAEYFSSAPDPNDPNSSSTNWFDWHEQLSSTDWQWVSGTLCVAGTVGGTCNDPNDPNQTFTGQVSSDSSLISFIFGDPSTDPGVLLGTAFYGTVTLQYVGGTGAFSAFAVSQWPSLDGVVPGAGDGGNDGGGPSAPLPGTPALLAIGLAALGFRRRAHPRRA